MTAIQTQLNPLQLLQSYGQSVWLDYTRHSLITSGELKCMVDDGEIWGVTFNPYIFQKAIALSNNHQLYSNQTNLLSPPQNAADPLHTAL
uniref:hypothetical protein n=1 Tax=Chlorogloea sp. CCALA 695 TaxID=2107693 RepID=UPI001304BD93|nr:hypothetical protein [Chlorogloea sp. CCALA 695]